MNNADPSRHAAAANEEAQDITGLMITLSADLARLVGLEARLFGYTVLAILALTVVIALLLVGGWLFIGAALVMSLASLQVFSLGGGRR